MNTLNVIRAPFSLSLGERYKFTSVTRTPFSLNPKVVLSEDLVPFYSIKLERIIDKTLGSYLLSKIYGKKLRNDRNTKFLVDFLRHRFLLVSFGPFLKEFALEHFSGKSRAIAVFFIETPEVEKKFIAEALSLPACTLSVLKKKMYSRFIRYFESFPEVLAFLSLCDKLWHYRLSRRKI
ncbi:MAG: hypothetical protein ABIM32_03630 [candidate division WOR-3 bacterium]